MDEKQVLGWDPTPKEIEDFNKFHSDSIKVRRGFAVVDTPKVHNATVYKDELYIATDKGLFVLQDGKAIPVEFVQPAHIVTTQDNNEK